MCIGKLLVWRRANYFCINHSQLEIYDKCTCRGGGYFLFLIWCKCILLKLMPGDPHFLRAPWRQRVLQIHLDEHGEHPQPWAVHWSCEEGILAEPQVVHCHLRPGCSAVVSLFPCSPSEGSTRSNVSGCERLRVRDYSTCEDDSMLAYGSSLGMGSWFLSSSSDSVPLGGLCLLGLQSWLFFNSEKLKDLYCPLLPKFLPLYSGLACFPLKFFRCKLPFL